MPRLTAVTPRTLDIFVVARFLSYFADAFKSFVIPVLVFDRTGSAAMSGIALAAEYAPKTILLPLIGSLSQRFLLRPQFLLGDGVRAVLCVALMLRAPTEVVIVISAVIAVASSYGYLLNESLVAAVFTGDGRTVAQARLQACDQIARVAGPALGAVLYAWFDFHIVLTIAAAMFLLSGLGLFSLPKSADRPVSADAERANAWEGIGRGFTTLRRSAMLLRLTSLMFAANFAGGVALAISPAMIADTFGLPLSYFGVVASVASASAAAIMMFIGRRASKGANAELGRHALTGLAVGLVVTTAAPNFLVFMLGYSLFTVATICFATYMRVERLRHVPPDAVGETIGVVTALLWLSVPASGALVAALAGPIGLRPTMLIASVVTIFSILLLRRGLTRTELALKRPSAAARRHHAEKLSH
jgi:MFS family permease